MDEDLTGGFSGFNDDFNYTDYNPTPMTELPERLHPITCVALVVYALVFLVGTLGNGAVIWVVGFQMKPTVNTVWFLNLSVADLLCCLVLPFLAIPLACHHRWYLGNFACKLLPSLTILNMFASVLLLTFISMDRCALVLKPVWCQNYRSARLTWMFCCVAWVAALLLTIPSFLTRHTKSYGSHNWTTCGVQYASHTLEVTVAVTRFLFGFLIPLAVISISYGLVIGRVHSSRFRHSKKTLKVVLVVVVGFFVCWAPYHIVGLILASEIPQSPLFEAVRNADPLVVSLAFLNSCINPIIYVIVGQDFKTKMWRSLKVMLRNVLSEEATLVPSLADGRTQATGTTTNTTEDLSASTTL
ncbi:C5a anaphylatoxin chemotactic receptor 1 [Pogona vitticeps]